MVSLRFNVTDDHATKFNCSLWTNVSGSWRVNKTYVNIGRTTANYDVLYGVPEGVYGWTVGCSDGVADPVFPFNAQSNPAAPGGKSWTFYVKKP